MESTGAFCITAPNLTDSERAAVVDTISEEIDACDRIAREEDEDEQTRTRELRSALPKLTGPMTPADRVKTIRRCLLDLQEGYNRPDELVLEQEALKRVIDAWDEYEYAAGTAEGCEHEVIS